MSTCFLDFVFQKTLKMTAESMIAESYLSGAVSRSILKVYLCIIIFLSLWIYFCLKKMIKANAFKILKIFSFFLNDCGVMYYLLLREVAIWENKNK